MTDFVGVVYGAANDNIETDRFVNNWKKTNVNKAQVNTIFPELMYTMWQGTGLIEHLLDDTASVFINTSIDLQFV